MLTPCTNALAPLGLLVALMLLELGQEACFLAPLLGSLQRAPEGLVGLDGDLRQSASCLREDAVPPDKR